MRSYFRTDLISQIKEYSELFDSFGKSKMPERASRYPKLFLYRSLVFANLLLSNSKL